MIPIISPLTKRKHLPGLIAEWDPGRQVKEGTTGQSLIDYSNKQNIAQLGSAAGADTNDPTWTSTGLSFGADDYCDAVLSILNGSKKYTIIAVAKKNNGVTAEGEITNITNSQLYHAGGSIIAIAGTSSTAQSISSIAQVTNVPFCVTMIVNGNYCDVYSGLAKGSSTVKTSAGVGTGFRIGGLNGSANYGFQGDIYYAAVYNQSLSDGERIREYLRLQKLMANRGITI